MSHVAGEGVVHHPDWRLKPWARQYLTTPWPTFSFLKRPRVTSNHSSKLHQLIIRQFNDHKIKFAWLKKTESPHQSLIKSMIWYNWFLRIRAEAVLYTRLIGIGQWWKWLRFGCIVPTPPYRGPLSQGFLSHGVLFPLENVMFWYPQVAFIPGVYFTKHPWLKLVLLN